MPAPTTQPRRIFIVGCPRSGTTLVQTLLGAHPTLAAFPEGHLFDKEFRPVAPGRYMLRPGLQQRVRQFLEAAALDPARAADLPEQRVWRPGVAQRAARRIIALLDDVAAERGAAGWIEKTPDHVFRIPLLQRVAPGAHFVHVVRRPEGVLPSLHGTTGKWIRQRSWTRCGLHWLWAVWVSHRCCGRPRHHVISYEQLAADAPGQMRALFEQLGLDWRDDILERYRDEAANVVGEDETWKINNFGEIEDRTRMALADLPWPARCIGALPRRLGWLNRADLWG